MPAVIDDGDGDEPQLITKPPKRISTLTQEAQDALEASLFGKFQAGKRRVIPASKITNPNNAERETITVGQRRTADEALGASELMPADKPAAKRKKKNQPNVQGTGGEAPQAVPPAAPVAETAPQTNITPVADPPPPPIEIQEIPDEPARESRDAAADLKHFYDNKHFRDGDTSKALWDCKLCKKQRKSNCEFVADYSTRRGHMERFHREAYLAWCKANTFLSMLPKDSKARREGQKGGKQTSLNENWEGQQRDVVIPYTHQTFIDVAREWLISTDQPLSAMDHPKFREMIHTAARAKNGVKIPRHQDVRKGILEAFRRQMREMKKRLSGPDVQGRVSLTTDGWQAENSDAYLAVTAHWIEKEASGGWKLHAALIGFTRVKGSHTGRRLGEVLFKIAKRVGIAHKIGGVTCDNASNNDGMVVELELRIREAGWQWSSKRWRIRCMAHVINLATQALLKSLSKAPHFNPHDPDAHLPEGDAESRRDVIGLVRAISVKERSSSQRKELFADIQNTMHESPSASTTANKTTTTAGAVRVYRLILDMPVRWSSTHAMLYRSFMLKECVTSFIQILYIRETDTAKKAGLAKLQMQASDWAEVKSIIYVLSLADRAQQAFSSDNNPSLHYAIPALEGLHRAWNACLDNQKFQPFRNAIEIGLDKVKEYYDRAADSDTSLFAILLDPTQKDKHFRQHWGAALHAKAIAAAKEIFKARYEEMEVKGQLKPTITNTIKATKVQALIDFSEFDATPTTAPETPASTSGDSLMDKAFNKYLYGEDEMMGGQTVVEWWGANQARYPVWASLAADYLPMQASSVASERAFSSAGITITKRRNRLQGDIVEALQVLKSLYRRNLMKGSDNPTLENEWQLEKNYQEAEQEEEEVEARIEEVQEVDEEDINLAVEVDCASDSDWEDI